MGAYFSDYIAVAMEQDLAEDVYERNAEGLPITTARSRLIGQMRADSILWGSLCIPDTALFCGPLFTSNWTDYEDFSTVIPELAHGSSPLSAGLRVDLTVLLRAPTLSESLLKFVFTGKASLATPVLQLAPARSESMEDVRRRAQEIQAAMISYNESKPAMVQKWYSNATRQLGDHNIEGFVDALIAPYRAAFDQSPEDPDIRAYKNGWLGALLADRNAKLRTSPPDRSVMDTTSADFTRMLMKLCDDFASRFPKAHPLRHVAVRLEELCATGRVTHGRIQTAIANGIMEVTGVSYSSELSVMDHEAGISIRSPRRIDELGRLVRRHDSGEANRLLLSIHHQSEAIRAAHFARQHHAVISVPPISATVELMERGKDSIEAGGSPNLALTRVGRILRVADLSAYLGSASIGDLTEIKLEYIRMLRERYGPIPTRSVNGAGSYGVLERTIAEPVDNRRALLEDAMIKVFTQHPSIKRMSRHLVGDMTRTILIPAAAGGGINEIAHTGALGAGITAGGVVVIAGKSYVSRMNPNGKHYALLRLQGLKRLRIVGASLRRPPLSRSKDLRKHPLR